MLKYDLKSNRHGCKECVLCSEGSNLIIKSEPVNLSLVRNQIKQIGEYCKLSDRLIFDLQVAVGEAAANAVEHGSPLGCKSTVNVLFTCNRDALTISVKDEGKFKRHMPGPSTEVSYRGRGIPLMLALMDRVTIDEAKDGTCVILSKRIKRNNQEEDIENVI